MAQLDWTIGDGGGDPGIPSSGNQSYILTVAELTKCIRGVLEAEDLFRDVWVRGEISNLTRHGSGHIYFSLKDESAVIKCVIWNSASRSRQFDLREGMRMIARGRLSVYEKQGQYQLSISEVKADGVGDLYAQLEELKARLREEGLFADARKKPIPAYPMKIALITSPTGAALRDMVSVARKRMPCIDLMLIPAQVQGEGSEAGIAGALRVADEEAGADVIVVGRGGGSLEDLWSFNSEVVVRAIAACDTPVVSAVGHETDFTLADFVADLRAPTPSAALEMIVPDYQEVTARLDSYVASIRSAVSGMLSAKRSGLEMMMNSATMRLPERLLQNRWQELDNLQGKLGASFSAVASRLDADLARMSGKLQSLSPLGVLARGYTITKRAADGTVVKSLRDVRAGDELEILVSDGRIAAIAKETMEGWS